MPAAGDLLVTGHTGFIGRAVVAELQRRGHRVRGASRAAGIDLRHTGALAALAPPTAIIHVAGRAGVPESWQDPAATFTDNLLPAVTVFDQARQWRVPVVLISSYMYGTPQRLPIDESHPLACNNPYARAKRMVEELAEAYHADFGIGVAILRPFGVYGDTRSTRDLIGLILQQVLEAPEIVVNDLSPRRDWLHVDDLARAVALVAESQDDSLRVFNAGFGVSHSVAEVIAAAQAAAGIAKPVIDRGLRRPNEIPDTCADCRRLTAATGWRPTLDLAAGLAAVIATRTASCS